MSKWDKLLARILSLDQSVRFDELRKVLEAYGYEMTAPSKGSHCTFRKKGKNPITVPRHEPVKRFYVKLVRQVVEEDMSDEDTK